MRNQSNDSNLQSKKQESRGDQGLMDYSRFISPKSASRKPSAIRALQAHTFTPGMISLGGGLPHPSTFPVEKITIQTKDGQVLEMTDKLLMSGLQYGQTAGIPSMVEWLNQLQRLVHQPQIPFELCLGVGSQDVLTKAFDVLLSPGDSMLIESPAYVGILGYLRPNNLNLVEVPVLADGLDPSALEKVLKEWPDINTRPKVLYTVPIAGNPTGTSTSLEKKKQIYALAQKYDFIILEDDPYYFLQVLLLIKFGEPIPSYFSMDTDGRVLRFDSFSKILSAGARLGWVSGPGPLVERIVLHSMTTNLQPSGLSQAILLTILTQWGHEGFLKHVQQVAGFYKSKRDELIAHCERHLVGLAEWTVPTAGMFCWLKLLGVEDSFSLIKEKALEEKVLLVPGVEFLPNQRPSNYVRASYSMVTSEQMDVALGRLARLLKRS